VESIKADLSIVYRSMIRRIDARGLRLLQWVLFARHPLTLDELRFAIAIKVGMTDLNPARDLPYPSFIELALGLLVVEGKEHIVRFAHLTIKEYLSAHSYEYFPDGHQLLAMTCLTYLNFTALSSRSGCARYREDGELGIFFDYAAFEWGHHAREGADDTHMCNVALELLLSGRFSQLNELRCRNRPYRWLSFCQSPLHETCHFGWVSITVKLLQLGHQSNVNEPDLEHQTPLHYATVWGHIGILHTLLGCQNINVNVQDMWGDTPLHNASFRGHIAIIETLIQHSAIQVNVCNGEGRTPLHQCAKNGHEAVVQLLLNHPDIQTNVFDAMGQTPLHFATENNHITTIRALLCHTNIDVNCCDAEGWTALTTAIHQGSAEVVRMLLTRDDIDLDVAKRQLPDMNHVALPQDLLLCLGLTSESLYLAAQNGDKEVVLSLLHQPNLQLNSRYGENQRTALHEATLNGHVDIVEALLQHPEIEVNSVDWRNRTALIRAANMGRSDVVKVLLQHPNVAVNHRSDIGWTALTEAVDEGHAEIVRILLACPDIDISTSRVAEPGFWDMEFDDWIMTRKHTSLPMHLLLELGIWSSYE
jgi:ankyrin repeat protein